ncbi:MAG: hypothetical protein A2099_02210 [Planctomycetes bacterium GWF2_39_10]|nr:MAG: hypothetical protein A2Y09_11655 [Planctomycetes bacterium GWA2_39_15]OHB50470.1 MAG: hypothetical protein A2099_02210 [Planctomycetes bacterium GWF2_39_10]
MITGYETEQRKLRAKGLVDRVSIQMRYRVTHEGTRLAAVLPSLAEQLCNSIIGLSRYPEKCNAPEKLETSF